MPSSNYINRIRSFYGNNLIKLHSLDEVAGVSNFIDFSKFASNNSYINAEDSAYHRTAKTPDGRLVISTDQASNFKGGLYTTAFQSNFSSAKGAFLAMLKEDDWSSAYNSESYLTIRRNPTTTMERVLFYKSSTTPGALVFRHTSSSADIIKSITPGEHGSPSGFFWTACNWDSAGSGSLQPYFRALGGSVVKATAQTGVTTWSVTGALSDIYCCIGGQLVTGLQLNNWEGQIGLMAIWSGINLTDNDVEIMTKI